MKINRKKKVELITSYIRAAYSRVNFENDIENVFGDTWALQTKTGEAFIDMTIHYEDIFYNLLDSDRCDIDWLVETVDDWVRKEARGETHPPLYYISESESPGYIVDTEEQLVQYIINAPYLFFDGEEDND